MIELSVSRLNKRFGGNHVLKDVSFEVKGAEMIGLIGPNGCLLYTSPSPRDKRQSRMPSSA